MKLLRHIASMSELQNFLKFAVIRVYHCGMAFDAIDRFLGDVASTQAGYPFRTTVEEVSSGDVLVVQMKDVGPEIGVDWAGAIRTRLVGRKQPDWIQAGDILFAAKGARFYAVCAAAPPGRAVCVPAFFHLRVRAPAQVDPQFLAWQINQPPCQRQLLQAAEGSSQLSIRRSVLEQLAISIPPIDEQRRIAALAELAQLERRALQRLIANREQQLQAIAEDLGAPATHNRTQEKK